MIDLDGSWDPTAKTLGALLCRPPADRPPDKARPCVTPFAIDKVAPHGGAGYLTFVTRRDAKVKAAAAGLVDALVFLRHDPSSHSDIFNVSVRLALDSAFWLDYVSVPGPAVAVGDAGPATDT